MSSKSRQKKIINFLVRESRSHWGYENGTKKRQDLFNLLKHASFLTILPLNCIYYIGLQSACFQCPSTFSFFSCWEHRSNGLCSALSPHNGLLLSSIITHISFFDYKTRNNIVLKKIITEKNYSKILQRIPFEKHTKMEIIGKTGSIATSANCHFGGQAKKALHCDDTHILTQYHRPENEKYLIFHIFHYSMINLNNNKRFLLD